MSNYYKTPKAVNWNSPSDNVSEMVWETQVTQFWLPMEISVSKDKQDWLELTVAEREVFKKVLVGLTMLDSKQGGETMAIIPLHINDPIQKAVLISFAFFEQIHAKSYSNIFSTLIPTNEIEELFEWVETNEFIKFKSTAITEVTLQLLTLYPNPVDIYLAMCASVFLESFLFYSGFFYPLYLGGKGKMVASAEMIRLIVRDENIHGTFTGVLAQNLYEKLTLEEKSRATEYRDKLFHELYPNEVEYTEFIYSPIGLEQEVIEFLKYNANKAYMNLGLEPVFDNVSINPIVENSLNTESSTMDFFSVKGNSYVKASVVEDLNDDDFDF